jgi:dienelactone hydrolase
MPRVPTILVIVLMLLAPGANAQQEITFSTAPSERLPEKSEVEAILTMPANATGKVPAVVFIHSAGGYDAAKYALYGAALREAGIATLGVSLFRIGSSRLPSEWLPHTFGAFKYLAAHPQIEPSRIGIMGLSLGGILSMYTASAIFTAEHLGSGQGFAAHVPVYPACWVHEAIARGTSRNKSLNNTRAYSKLTGAPVHILAGDKDQLDDPDGCQKFLEALSLEARKFVELTVYPGATHVWDAGRNYEYFDRAGCKGRGCQVQVEYSPEVTAKGIKVVVDFFRKHLGAPSR